VNTIKNKNDYKSWTCGGGSIGAVGVQLFFKHWTFAKFLCNIRGLGVHYIIER
jgi:hypothetical protein